MTQNVERWIILTICNTRHEQKDLLANACDSERKRRTHKHTHSAKCSERIFMRAPRWEPRTTIDTTKNLTRFKSSLAFGSLRKKNLISFDLFKSYCEHHDWPKRFFFLSGFPFSLVFGLCCFFLVYFCSARALSLRFRTQQGQKHILVEAKNRKIMKNTSTKYDAVLISCSICFEYSKSTCARYVALFGQL